MLTEPVTFVLMLSLPHNQSRCGKCRQDGAEEVAQVGSGDADGGKIISSRYSDPVVHDTSRRQ